MDFWPANKTRHEPAHKEGPLRDTENQLDEPSLIGPVVSPGGGVSAAAILRAYGSARESSSRKRLEWDFITHKGPPLRSYPSTTLIPESRVRARAAEKLSSHRRAEEGARFLRQRYPDVDIPFEIIKEYMDDDYAHQKRRKVYPSTGNCLALVHSIHAFKDQQVAFAFPMGNLQNQLNLSTSFWSRSRGTILNIASSPAATFDTPVSQIVSSTHQGALTSQEPTFAVRTMSFVALFSVKFSPTRSIYNHPSVNRLSLVKHAESGTITDMAASPFASSRLLLVNDMGVISLMQADSADSGLTSLNPPPKVDSFWRVYWANEENSVLRASSSVLELLDLRGDPPTLGLRLPSKEKITAIGTVPGVAGADPHLITVTTDKRVIWLDDRYLTSPLISWEHNRAGDMTLGATTCTLASGQSVSLLSQNNGLVTMYDASVSSGLMHANGAPQVLGCIRGSRKRLGYAFYRHPASESRDVNFLELSTGGGLFTTRLHYERSPEEVSKDVDLAVGGAIVSQSNQNAHNFGISEPTADTSESYSRRESFEVDFRKVYHEIALKTTSMFAKQGSIDEIRDVLERMPRMWQESDQPLETIMTLHDIASCASAEPGHISRAEFLTSTVLNSRRAQSAFRDGRLILSDAVSKGAAWSFDLSRSIELIRSLDSTSTQSEDEVTYDEEKHGMQCLRDIDLALFNNVYSSTSFYGLRKAEVSNTSENETLQRATQSMSLTREQRKPPPPLVFSFLKPRPQLVPTPGSSITDPAGDIQEASLGTRLLLSDWELGSNPEVYRYVNPYPDIASEGTAGIGYNNSKKVGLKPPSPQVQTQPHVAPPRIGLVQSVPLIAKARGIDLIKPVHAHTQAEISSQGAPPRVDLTTRSQDPDFLGISTQILPGKHGGRSKGSSKKPKKRMGGF